VLQQAEEVAAFARLRDIQRNHACPSAPGTLAAADAGVEPLTGSALSVGGVTQLADVEAY
jgi:hypothetical protein